MSIISSKRTGRHATHLLPIFTICSGLTVATLANAQQVSPDSSAPQASADPLGEVVVVARRRAEQVQDVPISITAFGEKEIAARAMVNLSDAQQYTPNLTIQTVGSASGSGSNVGIFIRGVGQDDFTNTSDPGVGLYLDGVYLGRSVGSVLALKDVASLEVLRGPQGTLFGRNTIGGAVLVTTKKPAATFGGYTEITYGNDNLVDVASRVEGPLTSSTAAALSVDYRRRDGYGTSLYNNVDYGNENKLLTRLQFSMTPSDRVGIDFAGDYSRQRQNPVVSSFVAVVPNASTSLVSTYDAFAGARDVPPITTADLSSRSDPFQSRKLLGGRDDFDVGGTAVTVTFRPQADIETKSITAYRRLSSHFDDDIDGISQRLAETAVSQSQWQFSQELQFNGKVNHFTWASGLYYYREESSEIDRNDVIAGLFDFVEALPVALNPMVPMLPAQPCQGFTPTQLANGLMASVGPVTIPLFGCPGNNSDFALDNQVRREVDIVDTNYAGYLHSSYDFTEALNLALGARLTRENKDFLADSIRVPSSVARGMTIYEVAPTRKAASFQRLTPYVGLNYELSNDARLFASYSQGFKSGTFNGRGNTASSINDVVKPEILDAFELGWKSEILNRTLRLNGALFYNNYKDIQLTAFPPSITVVQDLINAGRATVKGAELEVLAVAFKPLQLGGFIAYADSRITKIDPAAAASTGVNVGDRLKDTPLWSYSTFAQYSYATERAELGLRVDYTWRYRTYHDAANNPLTVEGSHGLVSSSLSVATKDHSWSASLWGRNLTNQVYFNSLFQTPGATVIAYPARLREFGLTVKRAF